MPSWTSSLLDFVELPQDMRKETRQWQVKGMTGRPLGVVSWHAPWRRYSFHPAGNTLFDARCLDTIAAFLMQETAIQKESWKGAKR
jgi:hypothetical protein